MNEKILFRLTKDEFVNEAIAEMVRQAGLDKSQVSETEIRGSESDLESILSLLTDSQLYSNTHRRTSDSRYVNAHTDNLIPSSEEPFPDTEHGFSSGEITESDLESRGIPTSDFDDSSSSIYSKSPFYTGKTIQSSWSTKRIERYKELFKSVLFDADSHETEHSCRCCGRSDLPNWKVDKDIKYNQSFTPLVTKSGMKDLGQGGSQGSNYRGRCVACLVAGFAYSLIIKPVFTIEPGEYRIYCFKSDFKRLVSVRESYDTLLSDFDSDFNGSDPDSYTKTLPSNLPCQSKSDEAQLFTLLSELNKVSLEEKYKSYGKDILDNIGQSRDTELVQNILGATVFKSKTSKGGNPVRGITSMSSFSFDESVAFYLQPVTYESPEYGESQYYPHQLIQYLSGIGAVNTDRELYPQMVGRVADGLLKENISLIESGVFGLAKSVVNQNAVVGSGTSLLGIRKYLKMVFENMTQLNNEDLEALSSVGDSLGQLFDTRDDVSVLISLKNSNQLSQFLDSLERAGMESMKKAVVRGESVPTYAAVREDDLARVIEILSDESKFDAAKKVIVTHASFAALYQNSSSGSEDNNGD